MTRSELEEFLRNELHLTEVSPGAWLGRTVIPDLAVGQPFPIQVRIFGPAIGVAVGIGLRVDKNYEAVYEYLLETNGNVALGGFMVDDSGQILATAEIPCGSENGDFFSQEELGVMMMVLLQLVKDQYNNILKLLHGDKGGFLNWLKSARRPT